MRLTADGRHVLGMYYSAHRLALSYIALRVTSALITAHIRAFLPQQYFC